MTCNRTRYRSKEKAERDLLSTNGQRRRVDPGWEVQIEQCQECGGWHIGARFVGVPERPDIQAACTTKKRYTTETYARRVAAELSEARGYPLRAYGCPHCGGWHLTKMPYLAERG